MLPAQPVDMQSSSVLGSAKGRAAAFSPSGQQATKDGMPIRSSVQTIDPTSFGPAFRRRTSRWLQRILDPTILH